MYANTFFPVTNFKLVTHRCAEFGFFGAIW
jgi:hypothetical protein